MSNAVVYEVHPTTANKTPLVKTQKICYTIIGSTTTFIFPTIHVVLLPMYERRCLK